MEQLVWIMGARCIKTKIDITKKYKKILKYTSKNGCTTHCDSKSKEKN